MFRLTNLCAALLLLPMALMAGTNELLRETAPGWVENASVPQVETTFLPYTQNGIYYLLTEKQVRWNNGNRETYIRTVLKVLERAGLESAAKLTYNFNPSFDTLTMHRLNIIRDGEEIDVSDTTPDSVFRRESDFERGILDGTLTAHLEIADLRVGDVVDLAFSWQQEPIVEGLNYYTSQQFEWEVPLGRNLFRVLWPNDAELAQKVTMTGASFQSTKHDEYTEMVWQADTVAAVQVEDDVPIWYQAFRGVRLSKMDWNDISNALLDYYQSPHALPAEFATQVDMIAAQTDEQAARIAAALRLVQDKVRYVGIEIGSGAFYARDPETVLLQGFGDCKDKSVLLKTVLERLGISADVALVHNSEGQGLADRLPSTGQFNHMIVKAHTNSGPVWLDPTYSYQGGSGDSMMQVDYGYALPISVNTAGLEKMDIPRPEAPQLTLTEKYLFSDEGVDLNVTTLYRGETADKLRLDLGYKSRFEMFRNYFDYYAKRYRGLQQAEEVVVSDDLEANEIIVEERYHLPKSALDEAHIQKEFVLTAAGFLSNFTQTGRAARSMPLWQPYPVDRTHKVIIHNAPIWLEPPENVSIKNDGFSFDYKGYAIGATMMLDWHLRTHSSYVKPADVPGYLDDLDEMRDNTWWSWDLTPELDVPEKSLLERLFSSP